MKKPLLLLGCFISCLINNSFAQPGALDLNFDVDGKVTTDFDGGHDQIRDVIVQSDGKIIACGMTTSSGGAQAFGLVRYLSDGSPDSSFNSTGKVITNISTGLDIARAIIIQSDGKYIVGGQSNDGSGSDLTLVRYNTNGSLDTGFDTDGIVTTDIAGNGDYIRAIALQPDGKIVAAGYSDNGTSNDIVLARYNSDGTLDNGFGTSGHTLHDINSGNDRAFDIALQADGKIVVGGQTESTSKNLIVERYNSNGILDNTFNSIGYLITDVSGDHDVVNAIALQSDGKIVAGGYATVNSEIAFCLTRQNTDGTLDNSFGTSGITTTTVSNSATPEDFINSILIQSDGRILAGGVSFYDANTFYDFALARYETNGTLDNSFGIGGKVTTTFGVTNDYVETIALQPDGMIVSAGYTNDGGDYNFALTRCEPGALISIEDVNSSNTTVQVYPNPASDAVTITSEKKIGQIEIYDLVGKKIYAAQTNRKIQQLDVSEWKPGMYFVHINGAVCNKLIVH
jgi:uncharacterized delta-60 repeat protein